MSASGAVKYCSVNLDGLWIYYMRMRRSEEGKIWATKDLLAGAISPNLESEVEECIGEWRYI